MNGPTIHGRLQISDASPQVLGSTVMVLPIRGLWFEAESAKRGDGDSYLVPKGP